MSDSILACHSLVDEGIANEFYEGDPAQIFEVPKSIVEWGPVSLWAQHLGTGRKDVNLRSPGMIRWLKALAASGTGPPEEYEDVRCKFVNNKTSGTTSPVSSL